MKKFLLATVIVLILSVPLGVFAEDDVVFGSFWWEADNGLSLFASGGNGDCDVFGFEIITEKRTVQLPVIGADFSENYSVKITGISDGSYTLRGFACRGGVYFYSDALYVTVTNGEYSVKTQAELREAAKKALSEYVDKSLYREEEQAQIDEIIARYSESIDNAGSFLEYDGILESAYSELDALHIKEWYDQNISANEEVLYYLSNANEWLTSKRFVGKERQITDIIKPVVQEVLEMGSKGEILISNDYIRSAYADDIAQAKKIYNEDMSETERSRFNERLVELDTETADFLKEFFS